MTKNKLIYHTRNVNLDLSIDLLILNMINVFIFGHMGLFLVIE